MFLTRLLATLGCALVIGAPLVAVASCAVSR